MIRAGIIAATLALGGCASLSEGTMEPSQAVLFTSAPSGAFVSQGPRTLCQTPCQVRRSEMRVMEGYTFTFADGEAVNVDLRTEANGAMLGNILFGGIIGGVVDLASGRSFIREGHVHVEQGAE